MFRCVLVLLVGLAACEDCLTPAGKAGSCKPIVECPSLNSILNKSLTTGSGTFLKSHQCGFEGKTPKVCCETGVSTSMRNLLDETSCGINIEDKIVGGDNTKLDEFAWMALLQYQLDNGTKVFDCGGSLINNRYIVTAAHCVRPSLIGVRLGEHDLSTIEDCIDGDCSPAPVDIRIEKTIIHEEYDPVNNNQYNDIALLRLEKPVTFSDFIKPICLPLTAEETTKTHLGTLLSTAGWGITENGTSSNVKLKVRLPVKNNSACQNIFRLYAFKLDLRDTQMCAGGERGKDSCRGDSGGPLMALRKDKFKNTFWYLAGIVSFGAQPCGMPNWGGVYTRVGMYISWITSNLKP